MAKGITRSSAPRKMLRVAPAMEARLTDHVWTLEETAARVPDLEAKETCAHGNGSFVATR